MDSLPVRTKQALERVVRWQRDANAESALSECLIGLDNVVKMAVFQRAVLVSLKKRSEYSVGVALGLSADARCVFGAVPTVIRIYNKYQIVM